MNKQIRIKILNFEITVQVRTSQQTREFDPIQIDETKKKEALDALDLTSLQARARALRLAHTQD